MISAVNFRMQNIFWASITCSLFLAACGSTYPIQQNGLPYMKLGANMPSCNQDSILKQEDRKGDLNAIPESAFPKPAQMPVIPEAEDGLRMEAPPKDLPNELPEN